MGQRLVPKPLLRSGGPTCLPTAQRVELSEHQRTWNLGLEEPWTRDTDPRQQQAMGLGGGILRVGVGGVETERCPN